MYIVLLIEPNTINIINKNLTYVPYFIIPLYVFLLYILRILPSFILLVVNIVLIYICEQVLFILYKLKIVDHKLYVKYMIKFNIIEYYIDRIIKFLK